MVAADGAEKISVILPVYNGREFYEQALESIRQQEWPGLEIILVDDGSTDGLPEWMRQRRDPVRYVRQERRGPGAARNLGLRHAGGEWIAFLDIDDLWTAEHLLGLSAELRDHPEAGIAQGLMRQFADGPEGRRLISGPYRMPYMGSCLFRRRVLEQCGGFDESMKMGEDYDLMFRCWENDVPKRCVERVSFLYRRHAGNMTRGRNEQANLEVMQRRIGRIRCGAIDPTVPRRFPFASYIGELRHFDDPGLEWG